jgi:hypothetical protein
MSGWGSSGGTDGIGRLYDELAAERRAGPPLRHRLARRTQAVIGQLGDSFTSNIQSDSSDVEVATSLSAAGLTRLFQNETCGLRVPGFADPATCQTIADWMEANCTFEKWEQASTGKSDLSDMFYGIGLPVNAIDQSRERCIAYFAEALPTIHKIRAAAAGRLAPVDKLRLELDELWNPGATLRVDSTYHRKMLVGLGRLMRPDGMVGTSTREHGIIHIDAPVRISKAHGLFSANVYLRAPSQGGELNIWGVNPGPVQAPVLEKYLGHAFDPEHRERTQDELRRRLPAPRVVKIQPGDLVIINAGRPHAVRGFAEGTRITLQSFIEHVRGEPLRLFA